MKKAFRLLIIMNMILLKILAIGCEDIFAQDPLNGKWVLEDGKIFIFENNKFKCYENDNDINTTFTSGYYGYATNSNALANFDATREDWNKECGFEEGQNDFIIHFINHTTKEFKDGIDISDKITNNKEEYLVVINEEDPTNIIFANVQTLEIQNAKKINF